MKKFFVMFLAMGLVMTSCKKNDDAPEVDPEVNVDPEPEVDPPKLVADYPVQDFMWTAMNAYYFYQGEVADLADTRFTTNEEFAEFLSTETNPEDFFFNKLTSPNDRFSFLNEDFTELTNSLQGVFKSNGLEFRLGRFSSGDNLFGFVQYIVPNSNASTQNIERGDLFTTVNGIELNLNNYIDLLFGEADTYTLNIAAIENNSLVFSGEEVTLTKEEGLVENPILISKVIDLADRKVAYMMFNQFAGGASESLNDAFGEYKSRGVTDLVLDLRYNGGGFSYITQILASLIYGTNTDDLFAKRRFNSKIQATLGPGDGEEYFVETTGSNGGASNTPLNTLLLNKVYIIATGSSASASEVLINGLAPYMDVVHIGGNTVGKNQGSFTFVDDLDNGYFYDEDRISQINPNNRWAIQPIVTQNENADGFGDFSDGLIPDIAIEEDIADLGVLGDPNERLLARALQEVTGVSGKRDFTVKMPSEFITSSSLIRAKGGQLIMTDLPKIDLSEFK